jgi:hypothetical protein
VAKKFVKGERSLVPLIFLIELKFKQGFRKVKCIHYNARFLCLQLGFGRLHITVH